MSDENRENMNYHNLFSHGIFFFCVALDGYVIHRIPIRFQPLGLSLAIDTAFLIWTGIHSTLNMGGDPTKVENRSHHDNIYPMIDWKKNPSQSVLNACICYLSGFFTYLVALGVSILLPSRYCKEDDVPGNDAETGDV